MTGDWLLNAARVLARLKIVSNCDHDPRAIGKGYTSGFTAYNGKRNDQEISNEMFLA
jgi:hypothetical protein